MSSYYKPDSVLEVVLNEAAKSHAFTPFADIVYTEQLKRKSGAVKYKLKKFNE